MGITFKFQTIPINLTEMVLDGNTNVTQGNMIRECFSRYECRLVFNTIA